TPVFYTRSLHDALPILEQFRRSYRQRTKRCNSALQNFPVTRPTDGTKRTSQIWGTVCLLPIGGPYEQICTAFINSPGAQLAGLGTNSAEPNRSRCSPNNCGRQGLRSSGQRQS